ENDDCADRPSTSTPSLIFSPTVRAASPDDVVTTNDDVVGKVALGSAAGMQIFVSVFRLVEN
uniref:Uncharacterized protein n=1 Tax=Romanomermis culicivorax TaxID=13658 RepID=A0A915HPS5_ROMCU